AAAWPADRAAAMPVSAGTAPAARLRLRRTHRAVRYAGEPAAAIPRLRGGIVVPAEAVRDEVLPVDVLLADEAAPRNPARQQELEHGAHAGGGRDLDAAPVLPVDLAVADRPRPG